MPELKLIRNEAIKLKDNVVEKAEDVIDWTKNSTAKVNDFATKKVQEYTRVAEDDYSELVESMDGVDWNAKYENAKEFMPEVADFKPKILERFMKGRNIRGDKKLLEDFEGTSEEKYSQAVEAGYNLMPYDDLYGTVTDPKNGIRFPIDFEEVKVSPNAEFVTPEDSRTTMEKVKPQILTSYEDQYKTIAKSLTHKTPAELEEMGYAPKVIKRLQEEETLPPMGLESSFLDPTMMVLENKAVEMILAGGIKALAPVIKYFKSRNASPETIDVLNNGTMEEKRNLLNTIKYNKKLGVVDEVYTGGGSKSTNIHEQKRVLQQQKKDLNRNLRKSVEDDNPYDKNLAQDTQDIVQQSHDRAKIGVNDAYDAAEEATTSNLYKVKEMKTKIIQDLIDKGADPKVINEVKANLDYSWRNLTPEDALKVKELGKLKTGRDTIVNNIAMANDKLKLRNKELKGWDKKRANQLKEYMDSGKATKRGIEDFNTKTITGKQEIEDNIGNLKSTIEQSKHNLSKKKENIGIVKSQLPDMDYASEQDFFRMIKKNNYDIRNNPAATKHEKSMTEAYVSVKKALYENFETLTKKHNPEAFEKFVNAQNITKEFHKKYGYDTIFGKVTDTPDIESLVSTVLRDKDKVVAMGKQLMEESPEQARRFAQAYITKNLGAIKEGKVALDGGKGLDLESLSGSLDNIVNDREMVDFIKSTMGQEKVDQLQAMFRTASGLKTMVDKAGFTGDFRGIGDYMEGKGLTGGALAGLRYLVDGLRIGMHKVGQIGAGNTLKKAVNAEGVVATTKALAKYGATQIAQAPTRLLTNRYATGVAKDSTEHMDRIM
ncbi:MAG: hypothetical protein DRQ78_12830, partial [Epsilonproteobacteria bacterium]